MSLSRATSLALIGPVGASWMPSTIRSPMVASSWCWADPARYAALVPVIAEVAAAANWSAQHHEEATIGLRIVLGIQDAPTGPINASDVALLKDIDLPVWTVLAVLSHAGLLIEDRTPALDA